MKKIINEFRLQGLTLKQKAIVFYFCISLCMLCVGDETPLWMIALIVLNFANAARLLRNVPLPKNRVKNENLRSNQSH